MVTDAFEKALEVAKEKDNEENGIALVLNVDTENKATNTKVYLMVPLRQACYIKIS